MLCCHDHGPGSDSKADRGVLQGPAGVLDMSNMYKKIAELDSSAECIFVLIMSLQIL